jgi:protein-disulfide isomerase
MSNKTKKTSSGVPLAIIVVVLVLAVGGFAWLYTSKPRTAVSGPTPPAANRTPVNMANASVGASLGINLIGPANAAVTVEEFADFQCGGCAAVHPVLKDMQSAYAGNKNVRFIFRHYPLPGHDKSYEAATVVEAAGMQGKFWPMMDQLMTNQQAWTNAPNYKQLWEGYAQKIGVDVPRFQAEAAGLAAKGRVDEDKKRGEGLGVRSTPSVYVNGRLLAMAEINAGTMRQIIDSAIQERAAAAASASNTAANTNAANAK